MIRDAMKFVGAVIFPLGLGTYNFLSSNLEQNGARGELKHLRQMSHKFLPSEICCISSKVEQEKFRGLFMIASCLPFAFAWL